MLDDFESHRPLAGNDRRIVIAIDVRECFFFRDLMRVCFCLSKIFSVKNDRRAKFLAIIYFDQRSKLRHHHRRRNAEQFTLVGKRLRVIAGGCGDHATFLLIRRQLGQSVARTALLETSGALQVVELAENFHARDLAQRDGVTARGVVNRTSDPFARRFDILERDHRVSIYRASKSGNAFVFKPTVSKKSVIRRLLYELLDLVGGSPQPLVAHLLESGKLTLDDLKALEKKERKK